MSESGESAHRRGASLHRMPSPESTALPPRRVCEQARLSRDPRFDGLFFIAVTSTRIYCRPVCPVHPPKPSNITYYRTAAAAETAGFRPCLRCRPELSPTDGRSEEHPSELQSLMRISYAGLRLYKKHKKN